MDLGREELIIIVVHSRIYLNSELLNQKQPTIPMDRFENINQLDM